jgi:hypothetical protein
MKKFMLFLVACLLAACSGTTGTATSTPIPTDTPLITPTAAPCNLSEVGAFIDQALAVYQEFKDQIKVAGAATDNNLANEIEKLKAIKTEAEKLKTNPCTVKLYGVLLSAMDKSIAQVSGLLIDSSATARAKLADAADSLFTQISQEITRLFACLPNCAP